MNKFITLLFSFSISIFILFIYVVVYGSNLRKIYVAIDRQERPARLVEHEKIYNDTESTIDNELIYNLIGTKIYHSKRNKRVAKVPLFPLTSKVVNIINYENLKIPVSLEYIKLTDMFEQGNCGSCWVFATCAMISDRLYINNNIKKNLSIQQILNCFDPTDGCSGNSPEQLLLWLSDTKYKIGINEEIQYSQKYDTTILQKCKELTHGVAVDKESIKSITYFIDEINPDKNILDKNIMQMKLELLLYGPFWAAISVYEDLYTFTGEGVYAHRANSDNVLTGGHAIEIIGFYDYEKDRYWICRSSWVDEWPIVNSNKGVFKIKLGVNECGIESRCGAASPVYSINVLRSDISEYRTIKY